MPRLMRCLALLFFVSQSYSQSPVKGAEDPKTAPDKTRNTWAVIVGVSAYQNVHPLEFADKDALAFYNYLKSAPNKVPDANMKLLLNEQALSGEIYGALEWLRESVQANDRVIFYFSGHGDVEKKTIHQNGFLLANDAPIAAYMTKGTISIKFLQDYLETYIALNKAKEVLLIVDACRSGQLAGGLQGIQITMQALGQNWNNQIIKILSAQEGELSYEDVKWGGGRGVFSYYLMKGLQGLANRNNDSLITASELSLYLPIEVADATGNIQNPKVEGNSRQVLFSFDQNLLAKAKEAGIYNDLAKNQPSGSKGTSIKLDTTTTKLYEEYLEYLNKGRLLWGTKKEDTIHCALFRYNQLLHTASASALIPSIKSSFLSALQRKTQQYLDNYIKEDSYRGYAKNIESLKEMEYAKSLIDSTHILYNYISSRMYFLASAFVKDHNKAIDLLQKGLAMEDEAPYIYNRLGARYSDLEKYDSAIYFYEKTISLSPQWSFPYTNLGIVYRQLEDYTKSINYYQKAIKLNPKSALTYYNLGLAYRHMNEYEKAIQYYIKSISLDSTNTNVHNNLGVAYFKNNNIQQAIDSYQNALKVDSNYVNAYYNLACAYSFSENRNQGIQYLEKALQKGYKNFSNILKDKSLEFIRKQDEFKILVAKYFPVDIK